MSARFVAALSALAASSILAGAPAAGAAPDAAPGVARGQPVAGSAGIVCDAQAARYEGGKGFAFHVVRAGMVRIDNPLRPLTPDFTQVLEVVIGHKRATAYGPDFTSLRRGGPPNTMQGVLGGAIDWDPSLPILPDNLVMVADDGRAIASLAFKACEPAPEAAPEPPPKVAKGDAKGGGKGDAKGGVKTAPAKGGSAKAKDAPASGATTAGAPSAEGDASGAKPSSPQTKSRQATKKPPDKTPSGFTMPSGALPE